MIKKIIGLVIVLGLIGAIFGYQQYAKTLDKTADLKSDITLNAQDLFLAYESDESAANKKFLDKIVEVKGVVASTKEDDGKSNIYLETEDMLANIACQMENKLIKVPKEGTTVTIKGVCTGYLSDVVLVRAVLIK